MCAKIDSLGQMQMMENFFQNMSARTTIPDGSPGRRKILQRRQPEASKRGSTFSISSAQKPKESFQLIDTNLENCWICENWVETEFGLDLIQVFKEQIGEDVDLVDDLGTVYEVFIHFDFDDYKPDRLDDLRKSGSKG